MEEEEEEEGGGREGGDEIPKGTVKVCMDGEITLARFEVTCLTLILSFLLPHPLSLLTHFA